MQLGVNVFLAYPALKYLRWSGIERHIYQKTLSQIHSPRRRSLKPATPQNSAILRPLRKSVFDCVYREHRKMKYVYFLMNLAQTERLLHLQLKSTLNILTKAWVFQVLALSRCRSGLMSLVF